MSNGLTVYSDSGAIEAIERAGALIAKGGLYGCKNPEQGATLVLMAHTEGLPIAEMRKRYHIINSNHGSDLTLKASWMLAEFRRIGGEFTWVDQGDDGKKATIRVKYLTNDIEVTFTIEDAKRQGLVKAKSAWEKDPGAMLRSRAQTKAIRMVCPEVMAGFATDTEIDPDSDAIVVESRSVATSPADAKGGDLNASAPPATVGPEVIEDVEYVVNDDAGKITGQQLSRITELFRALGMPPEKQLACAQKRGADSIATLTEKEADDLLAGLESRYKAKLDAETETSTNSGESVEERVDAPVGQQKIEQIKSLLMQIVQTEGNHDFGERFKAKLAEKGVRLSELTDHSAGQIIKLLTVKNLDEFFKLDLKVAAAKNG